MPLLLVLTVQSSLPVQADMANANSWYSRCCSLSNIGNLSLKEEWMWQSYPVSLLSRDNDSTHVKLLIVLGYRTKPKLEKAKVPVLQDVVAEQSRCATSEIRQNQNQRAERNNTAPMCSSPAG